jgi:hypothetical protein
MNVTGLGNDYTLLAAVSFPCVCVKTLICQLNKRIGKTMYNVAKF